MSRMFQCNVTWYLLLILISVPKVYYADIIDNETETIQYLSNLITESLSNASTYELPTNADMHRPVDEEVIDYGTYDFVIIGGGTTGCVIASRLSEIDHWKVLILEAGKFGNNFTRFPSSVYTSILSEYNWGFKSIPQTTACLGMTEQRCSAAQGKGMGGTSLIDGMVHQYGDPKAFDKWAEILNDSSWSYENVLPLFNKYEDFEHTNRWAPVNVSHHGNNGYLKVEHVLPPDELTGVFLDANKILGYNIADYNGPFLDDASVFQLHKKHGQRQDSYTAFLEPFLYRDNLTVLTESYVTKIEIDKVTKVATGVTFTRDGKTYNVKANKEIILSAGVYMSPKILMQSGVGPKTHLDEVGIDVIEDLEVGSVLIDDVATHSFMFTYTNLYFPNQTQEEQVKDFLHGIGTQTTALNSQGVGWYRSKLNNDTDFADIELYSVTSVKNDLKMKITGWKNESYSAVWGSNTEAIQIVITNVNPSSRGSVRLSSKDPFEFPLIDFNLLSDPEGRDIAVLYEGLAIALQLFGTSSFRRLDMTFAGIVLPGCEDYVYSSDEYWYCFLRQTSVPGYQSKGSCPMGIDPTKGAVVDSNFRVFGINKLRVCFPQQHPGILVLRV